MEQEGNFASKENHKILINLETAASTPWWKKILKGLAAIGLAVFAWLFYYHKDIRKLDSQIEEKKKKDKELKEKEDTIKKNIAVLKNQAEQASTEAEKKREAFNEFVAETKEESKKFDEALEKTVSSLDDTDANIDWVKQRFGGEITINE